MSIYLDEVKVCANCGEPFTYTTLCSISGGPCDLDMRPTGLARSAIDNVIQICPRCGYASYGIESFVYGNEKEIIESKEGQAILKSVQKFYNEIEMGYSLIALIAEKNKDYYNAGTAYLRLAWKYDDYNKKNEAKIAREKALSAFLKLSNRSDSTERQLTILDLYRRTGNYKKAKEFAKSTKFTERKEISRIIKEYKEKGRKYRAIKRFELFLSRKKDSNCHNVSEVLKK